MITARARARTFWGSWRCSSSPRRPVSGSTATRSCSRSAGSSSAPRTRTCTRRCRARVAGRAHGAVRLAALAHILRRSTRPVLAGLVVLAVGGRAASGVSGAAAALPRGPERSGGGAPLHRAQHPDDAAGLRAGPHRGEGVPGQETLAAADLARNEATIKNIRLWDYPPLLRTFAQLQEIRTYYKFVDVDNDRYLVNGEYRQLMLSPGSSPTSTCPGRARTSGSTSTYLHPRLRRGGGAGEPHHRRGVAGVLRQGHPARSQPRPSPHHPAGDLLRRVSNEYVLVRTRSQELDYPRATRTCTRTTRGGAASRSPRGCGGSSPPASAS